ncbi:D-alanine--D-alanine ligase family protein [uncultured Agrococcus sp.]|uniref:D-alanine--D-alanine ligase family protein n=1 Tax=uncultured Agrococcus sp. TaxID=382258 RepID=UPI00344F8EFD
MTSPRGKRLSSRIRVGLLFGGRSSEHTISLVTAASVMAHIDRDRFEPVPIVITKQGTWLLLDGAHADFSLERQFEIDEASDRGAAVIETASYEVSLANRASDTGLVLHSAAGDVDLDSIDVFFPLFHGRFGEDGTVQGMLELFDRPYVGAGVLASAVGQDKHFTKTVLEHAGLAVAPWVTVSRGQWQRDAQTVRERVAGLSYPLFVKPARAGSSVGVSRVDSPGELDAAMDVALAEDNRALIEQGIAGREIEVGVLGGRNGERARASLPGEIVVDQGYYDFEAKYLGAEGVRTECPAQLPQDATERLQKTALRAFEAISGAGLARVDFFVTEDGEFVLNEINTMPGFTPISMFPVVWDASGIDYTSLISELIELALEEER